MSISAIGYAVRHEAAPSREVLEGRIRERATAPYVPREMDAALFAYHIDFVYWRYFASAFVRSGREGDFSSSQALAPSDDPLVWSVRARHSVADQHWLSTPEDVALVHERLRSVTAEEFADIFQAEHRAVVAEYEASGHTHEAALREAGPDDFRYEAIRWGSLRAFYARAAAEGRYVVADIGH